MTARNPNSNYSVKNRPQTVHTLESLYANTIEEGECLLWNGYVGNKTPQVCHAGKMVSVRRLILTLEGKTLAPGDHAACGCGVETCIAHIEHRTKTQHAVAMGKALGRNQILRSSRMAQAARESRAKLTIEQAREIRCSDESGPVLASQYGVNKSLVARIRRNEAWREFSTPFSGLGARA